MKKQIVIFMLLAAVIIIFQGCAYMQAPVSYRTIDAGRQGIPTNGSYSQADYIQWEQQQLALQKLRESPAQIGSATNEVNSLGYLGIVKNFSRYQTYNFIIAGPETVSLLLSPGQQKEYSLIPGKYTCTVFHDNYSIGRPWIFHVTTQKHYFMDRWVYWYVVMQE